MIRVGIADAHGIESYLPEDEIKIGILSMRASLNRQRHSLVYRIDVTKLQDKTIKKFIENENFVDALKYIKNNVATIGIQEGYEKSWKLIPNHNLDPWY